VLQENDIGQDFALFYTAYAAYLELRGSFEKAESVFQTGLKRYEHQQTDVSLEQNTQHHTKCEYKRSKLVNVARSRRTIPSSFTQNHSSNSHEG
jgi:hypothetical protein